jgi:hypothetical protein
MEKSWEGIGHFLVWGVNVTFSGITEEWHVKLRIAVFGAII